MVGSATTEDAPQLSRGAGEKLSRQSLRYKSSRVRRLRSCDILVRGPQLEQADQGRCSAWAAARPSSPRRASSPLHFQPTGFLKVRERHGKPSFACVWKRWEVQGSQAVVEEVGGNVAVDWRIVQILARRLTACRFLCRWGRTLAQ